MIFFRRDNSLADRHCYFSVVSRPAENPDGLDDLRTPRRSRFFRSRSTSLRVSTVCGAFAVAAAAAAHAIAPTADQGCRYRVIYYSSTLYRILTKYSSTGVKPEVDI